MPGGQTDGSHPFVADPFHIITQQLLVQTDHAAIAEEIGRPVFFLLYGQIIHGHYFTLRVLSYLREHRIILRQDLQHLLCEGQMHILIAGNKFNDLCVALHLLELSERPGARE